MSGVTSIIAASDLEAFGLSATHQHNFHFRNNLKSEQSKRKFEK